MTTRKHVLRDIGGIDVPEFLATIQSQPTEVGKTETVKEGCECGSTLH